MHEYLEPARYSNERALLAACYSLQCQCTPKENTLRENFQDLDDTTGKATFSAAQLDI